LRGVARGVAEVKAARAAVARRKTVLREGIVQKESVVKGLWVGSTEEEATGVDTKNELTFEGSYTGAGCPRTVGPCYQFFFLLGVRRAPYVMCRDGYDFLNLIDRW
jgi:hypothetical protein